MNFSEYVQDVLFSHYENRISDHLKNNRKLAAQSEAFEWLHEYKNSLCITVPWNWKIAKKQISAFFFGKPPSVQLGYSTDIMKGLDFIKSHSGMNIRCSYHKYDTACHSESRRINEDTLDWFLYVKGIMSEKDIVDIFTECSTSSTTCFRRFSLQYNEDVSYEMGFGQAMYVFESERGQHDVATMKLANNTWKTKDTANPYLKSHLQQLISFHEDFLAIKMHCICYFLGIPQISIEGYYDTSNTSARPIIVDIDLPFDRAFF